MDLFEQMLYVCHICVDIDLMYDFDEYGVDNPSANLLLNKLKLPLWEINKWHIYHKVIILGIDPSQIRNTTSF